MLNGESLHCYMKLDDQGSCKLTNTGTISLFITCQLCMDMITSSSYATFVTISPNDFIRHSFSLYDDHDYHTSLQPCLFTRLSLLSLDINTNVL